MPTTNPPNNQFAGPSFVPTPDAGIQPHPQVAISVLTAELEELSQRAAALAVMPTLPLDVKPRIAFIAENMWRLWANFSTNSNFDIPT